MTKDQEHILNELESFHLGKLNEIRVKRGYSTLDHPRKIVIGGAVNLKIDPRHRQVILSWEK